MADKTTVAFRVDESVKEEWEEAAESPEYDSLSHLIRLSVQREITGERSAQRTAEADTQTEEDGEVLQSVNRIERMVSDVQEQVEAVGRETHSEATFDMKQVLLEVLPTAPSTYSPAPNEAPVEKVGETPHEIAGRIGADTSEVAPVLEELSDSIGQVREFNNHFWRTE